MAFLPKDCKVGEGEKFCHTCQLVRPATEDWFDHDAEAADGWKPSCKPCRKGQKTRNRVRKLRKVAKRYEMTVANALSMMSNGGANCPHSAELLENVVTLLGGVQGMAKLFVSDYLSAAPGSPVRQKSMANLMKLTSEVTATGAAKLPKHLMSNEDIDREMQKLMLKVYGNKTEVIESTVVEDNAAKQVG